MTAYLDAALAADAAGINVVPPSEDGLKVPIAAGASWKVYQERRSTRHELDRWYAVEARTGVGHVCGRISDNAEMLECESREVYDAFKQRGARVGLGDVIDRIEAGWSDATPGGGIHLNYRCLEIGGNTKLAQRPKRPEEMRNEGDTVAVLIETRGEGGFSVDAPSNGKVHPTGKPYVRLAGGPATMSTITPEDRRDLFALARTFDQMPRENKQRKQDRQDAQAGDRPGDDFNARADWGEEILGPHKWEYLFARGNEDYWRRPGKDKGISATTNYGGYGFLYVFSTSTPFTAERGYDKFGAYAVLNHGGDTAAAARDLAGKGYGKQKDNDGSNGHGTKEEARQATPEAKADLLPTDFASYLPERKYIYMPTGKIWEPAGIDRYFPTIGSGENAIKQSEVIDKQCPVHDLTWAPGRPQIIDDAFLDQGGWVAKPGARVYNGYRPPRSIDGNPALAGRWLDHVHNVYPDDAEHLITWLAHRVQRPGEKVNHALVLGGAQGIGKDTILEPVRHAVGPWNFGDVSPVVLQERFNAFLKSVVLRVSELRDLGDRDRFGFYEHTKTVIAAPPDTVRIDEKHIRAYLVPNVVGVVFTTNHRTDGLYLPAEDRRHYVAWSDLTQDDFPEGHWADLYRWFADDGEGSSGSAHVAAFLAGRDLSRFDPKAPPPKTAAFWDVVAAGRAPEDADIADVIAKLGEPDALTIGDIEQKTDDLDFRAWLKDRRNSRQIPHRFESAGYVATRNPEAKDGLWAVSGKRQVVYVRRELSLRQRIEAARKRTVRPW